MKELLIIPSLINKGIPQVENMIDQLPRHKTRVYEPRPLEQVDTFTFHHMASESPLINQCNYHINVKGWAALGYAIVIWGNRIIQCNPLDVQTNHTKGYNHRAIGVAVLADLSKRSLTDRERELIIAVFVSLNAILPGRLIKGHNECGVATTCPATSMNAIRSDIMSLEQKIIFESSTAHSKETAFKIANQTMYVYNMAQGKLPDGSASSEGQQKWAVAMLMKLYPFMQENKLFG